MGNKKQYWKSLEQLNEDPNLVQSSKNEFAEEVPIDSFLGDNNLINTATPRRDFLKFLGFSVTAASLAACETPVTKAIPYLIKPEEITPGVANWYASTYYDGNDFANILVKTREGRPIFVTGNKSGLTKGGVNARINSSVLSLYDNARLKGPMANGEETTWDAADSAIKSELEKIAAAGGAIRILTNSVISPSTKQVIADFSAKYANVKQVTYDAISYAAIIKANEASFAQAVIPTYDFSKAKVIVSFAADFLSEWLSSVSYSVQYGITRKPSNEWMSRHYQFETNLSLSGSNADTRVRIKPSEQGAAVLALYNAIAKKAGAPTAGTVNVPFADQISKAADDLWANKGNTLVVAGANDISIQTVVNAINSLLGNYGTTIDLDNPSYLKQSTDGEVVELIKEMNSGSVSALFIYNVNPSYSLANSAEFSEGLKKVQLSVSFADRADETASLVKYICPDHHYLESWNDFNPTKNSYALAQPTISPLFKTRQAQQSLLNWAGNSTEYYAFIKETWAKEVFPLQTAETFAESFWNASLHNSFFELTKTPATSVSFAGDISAAAQKINAVKGGELELALYVKTGMGDGSQANNPWLQELPDPVSKITWDNYVTMAPAQMDEEKWGFSRLVRGNDEANVVEVTVNGKKIKLPVVPQPGQTYGTIGIALGYGRTMVGKAGDNVGQNAFPLISFNNETFQYNIFDVQMTAVGGEVHQIAATQTHHTLMGRDAILKETTLEEFKKDPKAGNPDILLATHEGLKRTEFINMWKEHPVEEIGHRWGMSIDLNSCIGCGSCVTACQSENNVAVVGKDEVRRSREMHWLRIDRYYTSDAPEGELTAMERAGDNPGVSFQPMLCQHCNHAPCETVCPVSATMHSNEGLNQMAYNRCVGTRYCANNCPYKVRRFNWFNYTGNEKFADVNPAQDSLARMVLNPDVIVRSRGVMEKCSFCVQRIQEVKLDAKKEGRKVKDGEVVTACSSACPTSAIIFGDVNDKGSNDGEGSLVRKLFNNPRAYTVLEEVGTKPNIYYLTKVRNKSNNTA